MKRCQKGAIVSVGELVVYAAALESAVELCEMDIDSHTRPNRNDHDAEYVRWMAAIHESLRTYKRESRKLDKFLRAADVKAGS